MRIAEVRLFRVEGEGPAWELEDRCVEPIDLYPEHARPTAGAGDAPTRVVARYVEVATDDGASGLYGPIDPRQTFLIATELRPHLLGADPLAIAALHDRMLRLNRHGRAGIFVNAISAVDNALWDLAGRVRGEPVYRLLGGPTRDRITAYASMRSRSSTRHRGTRRRSGSSRTGPARAGRGCNGTWRWQVPSARPSARATH
jgi:L-alanine-DL-glutamate epimerase-like enolase superfamily enzyme